MKNSKVRVIASESGTVIGVSQNNPEYGYVRVEQVVVQINEQGWLRLSKRSALLKGKVQDLLEVDYQDGHELSGKIVVKESFEPFNADNPDRDLKIAGDTGIICRVDDMPIYRQTFYTLNESAHDELIMHNNNIEIKEVMGAQKAIGKLRSSNVEL